MPNKARFRTLYDDKVQTHVSPTGEKTEIRHEPEMTIEGKRILKPTRIVPIYDLIQVGREETEIERIVKRAMQGDYNALNAMNGVYADISDAPNSLAQAQQMIINAKREFDDLPAEIKKEFEYNPEIYVAQVGTKEWLDKMGITAEIEQKKLAETSKKKLDENLARAVETIANGAGTIVKNGGADNE